jgi:putative oxidoreductase
MAEILEPIGKWFKKHQAVSPFYVRLVMGLIFMLHGYSKIQNIKGTATFFASLHIPLATFSAAFIGYLEFIGGIVLIMGFFTRYASFLLAIDMIVAIILTKITKGFPGMDIEFTLLGASLIVLFSGAGAWGFDEKWTGWFKKHHALGPFFLRLAIGIVFLLHGLSKLMSLNGTTQFFTSIGIPLPGFMGGFVAAVEFLGGIALIVGFFTRYASFLLLIDMAVAILVVHAKNGLGPMGIEIPLLLLAGCLTLMFAGPGKWGIEQSHV